MQTMREDAERIMYAAIAAAQPGRLVREALAAERLTGRIVLLAAGKAAWAMAQAACACVPVRRGIVITKDGHLGGALPPLELAEAGHPVPDARAFAAARRALALTQGLTAEDTVLVLLSGGASALFELPLVPEARLREITQRLLRSGADIAAMNAVRKRLSAVKGGRFAQHCAPARVVSILLSDVLGDRPDVIGSGPAVPDPPTSGEALEAAGQAGLLPDAALEALLRQETPKLLENARWHVVGGVRLRLIDTAGIRETDDAVERLGVERSRRAVESADLVIVVADGSHTPLTVEPDILALAARAPHWILAISKDDRNPAVKTAVWRLPDGAPAPEHLVSFNSVMPGGLDALIDTIGDCFPVGVPAGGTLLTNARQAEAIRRALESVRAAREALTAGLTPDVVLTEAEGALDALGEIVGKTDCEEVLDRIFSKFCIGK